MASKADEARDRRGGRAREDILVAAGRTFGRLGIAQTTMGDIAGEAGYTVPSLYAYFGGKDEIIEELGSRLAAEILAVFDEGFPEGLTSRQRVELLLRRLFSMTDRRREVLSVFFSLPMGAAIGDGFEVTRLRLARWFREHEEAARRNRRLADDLALALLGICETFTRRWLRDGRKSLLVNQASVVADLFLHGAQPRLGG